MPLPSLDELTTPLTVDDAKTSIYNVLAAVGVKTTSWKPGAVVRTIIAAVAIVISALSELQAAIAKSGFLELSGGSWLKLVAYHVFGEVIEDAGFAVGSVVLNNTGGGVFDVDAGDLVVKKSETGRTYRNTEPFHLGALQTGLRVGIIAVEAGSSSSALAGQIDDFETSMIGVTVTNDAALVGIDAPSDPEIRTLCLEKRSSLSPNGPRDAYSYFAKRARRADGTLVGVTRVRTTKSATNGHVTVTVASPSGAIPGDAIDPATDLGAVDKFLKENVVPDGVTETTRSATALLIPIAYELWIDGSVNLTDAALEDLIATRLGTFMSTQPINGNIIDPDPGKVFHEAIETVIGASRPETVHVIVSDPPGDVTVADGEVPMPSTVTATAIHRVTQ